MASGIRVEGLRVQALGLRVVRTRGLFGGISIYIYVYIYTLIYFFPGTHCTRGPKHMKPCFDNPAYRGV